MQVNIKIRDSLYKKLREVAKKEQRTITAQLDIILSKALEKIGVVEDIPNRNEIEDTNKLHRSIIDDTNNTNNTNNTKKTFKEEIKSKIKIYVETFKIDPMDTTMVTYNKCKKFIEENAYHRELKPNEMDITMFDEVQQERRKDREVNRSRSFILFVK